METQHIHEFTVLAETCNYQEAADMLHVSQSALSKHIQRLEEELGGELFSRTARTVTLSRFGTVFLDYAKQITTLSQESARALQRVRAEDSGRLVIAYPPALERYGLVELLAEFRQKYPAYILEKLFSVDPLGALRAGRCDFAFTQEDVSHAENIASVCYREDFPVAVLPGAHPLAKEPSIRMEQLREERFIQHNRAEESTTMPQMTLEKLCEAAGFSPSIAMSAGFSSTVVSLVSQGLGIAVMQRHQVPENAKNVALVRIQTDASADIRMIYLKTARDTPLRSAFLSYVQQNN